MRKSVAMGAPNVREGNPLTSISIQVLKWVAFTANIGADTYPLHETKLSMCGGHHVAAGGGKLHELGARILEFGGVQTCEAML